MPHSEPTWLIERYFNTPDLNTWDAISPTWDWLASDAPANFDVLVNGTWAMSMDLEEGTNTDFMTVGGSSGIIITSSAAKHGSYGAEFLADDTAVKYGVTWGDCAPKACGAGWINFNDISVDATSEWFLPVTLYDDDAEWACWFEIQGNADTTLVNVNFKHSPDTGGEVSVASVAKTRAGWHHWAMLYVCATAAGANNGYCSMYWDGELIGSTDGIDNDASPVDEIVVGFLTGIEADAPSGSIYLDDIYLDDTGGMLRCDSHIFNSTTISQGIMVPAYEGLFRYGTFTSATDEKEMTAECWINYNNLVALSSGASHDFLLAVDTDGWEWFLRLEWGDTTSNPHITAAAYDGTDWHWITAFTPVDTTIWHHCKVIWKASTDVAVNTGFIHVFVDGEHVGKSTGIDNSTTPGIDELYAGLMPRGTATDYQGLLFMKNVQISPVITGPLSAGVDTEGQTRGYLTLCGTTDFVGQASVLATGSDWPGVTAETNVVMEKLTTISSDDVITHLTVRNLDTTHDVGRIQLSYDAGSYVARASYLDDAVAWHNSPWSTVPSDTAVELWISLKFASGAGANNGYCAFYRDKELQWSTDGIDNDGENIDDVHIGVINNDGGSAEGAIWVEGLHVSTEIRHGISYAGDMVDPNGFAGTATKKTKKSFIGNMTFTMITGKIAKIIKKALGGTLTSAGVATVKWVGTIIRSFAGTLTPSGTAIIARKLFLAISGVLSSSGSIIKVSKKALAGILTPMVNGRLWLRDIFVRILAILAPTHETDLYTSPAGHIVLETDGGTIMADLSGIVAGEYGKTITLQFQDEDGNAQDISAYTTLGVIIKSPHGDRSFSLTGSTTVNNYEMTFAFDSGHYPEFAGIWQGMAKLEKTGELTKSMPFTIEVKESL